MPWRERPLVTHHPQSAASPPRAVNEASQCPVLARTPPGSPPRWGRQKLALPQGPWLLPASEGQCPLPGCMEATVPAPVTVSPQHAGPYHLSRSQPSLQQKQSPAPCHRVPFQLGVAHLAWAPVSCGQSSSQGSLAVLTPPSSEPSMGSQSPQSPCSSTGWSPESPLPGPAVPSCLEVKPAESQPRGPPSTLGESPTHRLLCQRLGRGSRERQEGT